MAYVEAGVVWCAAMCTNTDSIVSETVDHGLHAMQVYLLFIL